MAFNPLILDCVEKQNYRVTLGDVASRTGLDLNLAQQGLIALASEVGGHLQVAETGDIVYLFPKNFRTILSNKYWQIRLKQTWQKIWRVLFYLIRISFGIILIISIVLMAIAIIVILAALRGGGDDDNNSGRSRSYGGDSMIFFPRFSLGDFYWWFVFNPTDNPSRYREQTKEAEMGFLAAIFSFLFGDGDPNWDLEQRRWQMIGAVIRKNKGAVAAEQIAPYLDEISQTSWETEDYMLPVLSKFNGYPQVSPQGDIIYHFPELQVKAAETKENKDLPSYLREHIELFSKATSGQKMLAIGLGVLNIVLAIALSILLQGGIAAELGGIVAFVASIYWFLLAYGIAFLLVPTVRYFWLKSKNNKIIRRNQERQLRAIDYNQLHLQPSLKRKIDFARQFATEKVISQQDITYSTEQDLLDQNIERKDKIEEEWRKMLDKD